MKVTFKYSALAEYQRLVFNLYEIKSGFFKSRGFLVSTENNGDVTTVVIPQLNKFNTKKFLKELNKKDIEKYTTLKHTSYPKLYKHISKLKPIDPEAFKTQWYSKQKRFESVVKSIFASCNLNITVYLTQYGTVASYNVIQKNKLIVFLRKDADISQVAFCILAYFIHTQHKKLPWKTKQQVLDFLMSSTKIKRIFKNYHSIVEQIDKPSTKTTLEQSNLMYQKLGIISPVFTKQSGQFYANARPLDLSYSEKALFQLLYENSNFYVSFDDISVSLWGEDYSQFSLQAIAKVIQRIREKIQDEGLNYNCIKTKRKVGYMLIN